MRKICFDDWCKNNNRTDLLDYWSPRNDDPHLYASSSRYHAWFDFEYGSVWMAICDITSNKHYDPVTKYKSSFGYYLIQTYGRDAIEKYWSLKNDKSPFEYFAHSKATVYIKCQKKDYHEDYPSSPDNFHKGKCPYCASKKIHPRDSFAAYHEMNTDKDFISKYWHTSNVMDPYKLSVYDNDSRIKIQCQNVEYHVYETFPANFSTGNRCPYCKQNSDKVHILDSLGTLYPKIVSVWSAKNSKTPYEYRPKSHERVWLQCPEGKHPDFKRIISDYTNNKSVGCPLCTRESTVSQYERVVYNYLCTLPYTVLTERECTILPINPLTNYQMPFDNEVKELKLVVEVHGVQHYKMNGFHLCLAKDSGRTPEEEFEYQKWKDDYKRNYTIECGYSYLEIPYWTIETSEYKDLIDGMIGKISHNIKTLETAG